MAELELKKDILLAEDDHEDAVIFDMAMQDLNIPYTLRHAENGDRLFVLLKEKVPYILFMDIDMPCKDGVSCIAEIRKDRAYDNLPIIMYTAHMYNKLVEECYRNGANLYVTKAYTFSSLTEKLKKVFAIDWADYMHYPPQSQFVVN
ncbi:MAG: response regulator [Flavipsychrobacter sp.]|nr:response regulator [Flavipsychrobacter sp.]